MKKLFTLIAAVMLSTFSMMAQEKEFGDNLSTNPGFDGDDYSWVGVAAKPNKDNEGLKIRQGEDLKPYVVTNEEGSFLAVTSAANPSQPWDAQFWIVLPDDIQTGEQVIVSFKYRAIFDAEAAGQESFNVGTQGHKEPGAYLNNTGFGNLDFTSEWQTYDNSAEPFTVPANQKSIAFNLSINKDYEVTYCFDDIVIRREKPDETMVDYWKPLITNGDLESDGCPNFIVKEYGKAQGEATPEAGVGYEETAGIHIHVPARNSEDHDSQFFLYLNEPIPANDIIRVSFKYKASETLDETADKDSWRDHKAIGAQAHSTPGGYITWNSGFAEMHATTEWKVYEGDYQISSDASPSDNFQTMAFNLAIVTDHDYDLYLDEFVVKHKTKVPAGTNPDELALEEQLKELETKYNGMSTFETANKEVIEAFTNAYGEATSASDGDDYAAILEDLLKAESKYKSSVKDYQNLQTYINLITEKKNMAEAGGYDDLASELGALIDPLTDQYNEGVWTRSDINGAIDTDGIYSKVHDAVRKELAPGKDVTLLLDNSNYAWGTSFWKGSFTARANTAEKYHSSFNVYQTIADMPAGAYTIKFKGFQRYDTNDDNETGVQDAVMYVNSASKFLLGYAKDDSEVTLPNSMEEGRASFDEGNFQSEITAILAEAGNLTIGVKGTNNLNWVLWSDFEITYEGEKADFSKAVADEIEVATAVLANLEESITTPVNEDAQQTISEAQKVADKGESATQEECTKAVDALVQLIEDLNAAATLFAKVDPAFEAFDKAYDAEDAICADDIKARADKATEDYDGYTDMTLKQLEEYIAELNYLSVAVKVSKEALDATEENPFDLTSLIEDPDFEDYADLGQNKNYPGWSGTGFVTGGGTAGPVGERWSSTSGFNTYVEFNCLPAGKYVLSCDGAYRVAGPGSATDYTRAQEKTEDEYTPYLYATTSVGTEQVALPSVYSVLVDEETASAFTDVTSSDNASITVEDVKYYSPQQLYTADLFIKAGYYKDNKVTFYVGQDGKARLGVSKAKGQGNDWCFVDNFNLSYYGPAADAIKGVEVAKSVKGIYTISGVKMNSMNRPGLYIVNGKKITVK